ncbi:MAG: sigma-54 dependent transcriptional regulator [Bryobacteraceae bacterium]|jgi:DNA-binding NtrC family response regulator
MRKIRLLVVDDDPDAVEIEREILEDQGYQVAMATSGERARELLEEQFFDLLLLDERMAGIAGTELLAESRRRYPGIGAIFITGYGDLRCAVRALRAGALDLLQKPVDRTTLLAAVRRALDESQVVREGRYYRHEAQTQASFSEVIGSSKALQDTLQMVKLVTATDAVVLLLGESGTGKDLVARAIHGQGPRKHRPFIAVNASAVSPSLIESTLFGHKRGAFTDAKENRIGYFEAASGGTIFLDEVGEMSPEVQVRLLRVLEQKTIMRVGDTVEIPVDVRVIAATNRDLQREMGAGRFRADLFYRISMMPIELPPLRERKEDIVALAAHFVEKYSRELRKPITRIAPDTLRKLEAYCWPGNVRELSNVIQRAIILSAGDSITPDLIPLKEPSSGDTFPDLSRMPFKEAQLRFEQKYFTDLLLNAQGNKSRAAELAGIDRTVLYEHLKKLNLFDAR